MDLAEIYFRKKKKQLERITDYNVLYSTLIFSLVLILIIFSFAVFKGKILDPEVSLTPVGEQRLAELAAVRVETGILVHDFSEFDMLKNHFVAQATVWFTYNGASVDQALIDQFSFEKGTIKSKMGPRVKQVGDKTLALYDIELEFQGYFDYSHFPLDQHRLDLILVNPIANPNQLLYVTNTDWIQIAKDANSEGWSQIGKSSKFGYIVDRLASAPNDLNVTYEKTVFSFIFEHSSLKEAIIIFLPLILMFMVGLISLLLDMVFESRAIIELAVGSTLALVFFSNYVRTFTPKTGIFTLVDAFYVLLMVITSVIFLTQVFVLHYFRKKQKEVLDFTISSLNIIRCCMFLFIVFVLVFMVFYIFVLR